MLTIGITGGVGCGKTKILDYISENYNCRIITADEVANRLKEPGEACYEPIIKLLGKKILRKDGFIDKKKMAEEIFANDDLLDIVNSIIHPAVKDYILNAKESEKKAGTYDYLFIEAALLIECGYNEHVDQMWYIYTDESIRIKRLKSSRGYSEEKIKNIMDAQLNEEQFRAGSDFCIDNSGTLEETYMQIKKKMKELESEYGRK
jgi:dephospho-CoA kinase